VSGDEGAIGLDPEGLISIFLGKNCAREVFAVPVKPEFEFGYEYPRLYGIMPEGPLESPPSGEPGLFISPCVEYESDGLSGEVMLSARFLGSRSCICSLGIGCEVKADGEVRPPANGLLLLAPSRLGLYGKGLSPAGDTGERVSVTD